MYTFTVIPSKRKQKDHFSFGCNILLWDEIAFRGSVECGVLNGDKRLS